MANRFKLRLSKVITSFNLCRSKNTYRLPINPVPLSEYPAYHSFPIPPPSTPISYTEKRSNKRMVSETVKISCGGCRARSYHSESGGGESNDGDVSSTSPLVAKKRVGKRKGSAKGASLNVVVKSRLSSSSGDSGWFSTDESETLETSRNISNESDYATVKSSRRQTSKLRSAKPRQKTTSSDEKASSFRSKTAIGSIAVEKRSDDPLGDFKRSMIEMILEKEMFEMSDLEELLHCFLTLNSKHHHKVIVEAFTEIWESLFSKSRLNRSVVAKNCI